MANPLKLSEITELKKKLAGLDSFDDDELDKDSLRSYYIEQLKKLGVDLIDKSN